MSDPAREAVTFDLDGRPVTVPADGGTLLDALRGHLGVRAAVKDGCAPQGQCGCCTVLVDGSPRVACVTPLRRVAGRQITTVDGFDPPVRAAWAEAFCATGASQCGFCTPGIIVRLEGQRGRGVRVGDAARVDRALAAHLCRCTGWRTIHEAWDRAVAALDPHPRATRPPAAPPPRRDLDAASRRAEIEGGVPQRVGPDVALGRGGFADDTAPEGALVAVPGSSGGWLVAETVAEARLAAGKVQGRRTTVAAEPPLAAPPGHWDATLRTCWVEPGYLEPDAAWCVPGGDPVGPLTNGGAFGGKGDGALGRIARDLADEHRRPVRVLLAREDVVRLGSKRPPVAGGATADGQGILRVVRTPGVAEVIAVVAPGLAVEEVDVAGPPTATALRAAGWAEALVLLAGARGHLGEVIAPGGGRAEAELDDGGIRVRVACGDPLDSVVLRSYCIGAAHMALSWIRSEGLAVAGDGTVADLTIRSFGILRAADMPPVTVEIDPGPGRPVKGSDAVFAAVAAAAWLADGTPPHLPTRR